MGPQSVPQIQKVVGNCGIHPVVPLPPSTTYFELFFMTNPITSILRVEIIMTNKLREQYYKGGPYVGIIYQLYHLLAWWATTATV